MLSYQRFFFFLFFVLFYTNPYYSQIVATPSAGCIPEPVVLNGPAGATNVFWNTGIGTTTVISPGVAYTSPGTYNITYTALVGGVPVSYNTQVVVYAKPAGALSYQLPATRCAPLTATFTGSGGSPGSSYLWSFGDLSPLGNGSSLTHVYPGKGSFVPMMVLVDAVSGCTAVASSPGTIHVSAKPNLFISSSNGLFGCAPPFTTTIDGNSSVSGSPLPGPLQGFNWSFNSGSPAAATGPNAGVISFGQGTHTISLSASDNNQCSSSVDIHITVFNPSLTLIMQPTVCIRAAVSGSGFSTSDMLFLNHTGSYGYYQNKVNPGFNYKIDTVAVYYTPGLKTVTATIYPGGTCAPLTLTVPVFVEEVVPEFTLTAPHVSCQPTLAANYINLSTVNTSHSLTYTWTAGVVGGMHYAFPQPQYGTHPTFTFTQGSVNPYAIYRRWTPTVHLLAKSNSIAQCTAEVAYSHFDTVQRPTAWFNTDKREGCAPLSVSFRDTSFTLTNVFGAVVFPITSYTMYNGGVPTMSVTGTSSVFPVTFSYSAPGTYTPYMIIETINGCIDTSYVDTIRVVNPPGVNITYTPNLEVCAGQPVQLNMTANTAVQHWHATTDNGAFSGCVSNPSPVFPFTHTGTHTVTVSAYKNSCESTSVTAQTVRVKGPYGTFRYRTDCTPANRKTVTFSVFLQEAENGVLNFGDNSSVIITGNPLGKISYSVNHTYSATGNFVAVLSSSNSITGCSIAVKQQTVTVRDPVARITRTDGSPLPVLPESFVCKMDVARFSGITSSDVMTGCGRRYLWHFHKTDTVLPFASSDPVFITDTMFSKGNYTVSLIVRDDNNCSDTAYAAFRVGEVIPTFSFNASPICLSTGSVQILNNTQASQVPPDVIEQYTVNYGDGTPVVTYTNPLASMTHTYAYATPPFQVFTIVVSATNNLGCSGTTTRTFQVNNPVPDFQPSNLFPCLPKNSGATVSFSAFPGYASYSVSYGDPPAAPVWKNLNVFNNQFHTYLTPGIYTPTLIITDAGGCVSREVHTITAIGQATAGIGFVNGLNKMCAPGNPTIISTTELNVTPMTLFQWGRNGQTMAVSSQTYTDLFPTGITTVSFTVSKDGLCPSTATTDVIVADPRAEFVLDKNKFCLGDQIHVSLKDSSAVESWQWFFGDFVQQNPIYAVSPMALFNPTLAYTYSIMPSDSTGKTVLTMRYSGFSGTCARSSSRNIYVIKFFPGFNVLNSAFCLGEKGTYINTTRNPGGHPLNFEWDFGDQSGSQGETATHTYTAPGKYIVTMTGKEKDLGCPESAAKTITVYPLPTASLDIAPDMICPEVPFVLHGSGTPGVSGTVTGFVEPPVDSFSMTPGNTFTVAANVVRTTTYALVVKDDNNCESEPARAVINVPLPVKEVHWDTTVFFGQPVPINAFGGNSYTYSWTPNAKDLNCTSCYNPVSTSTVPITYTVRIIDQPLQCYISENTYRIEIDPRISLDVPSAFTPNGDGVNDMIFPAGWGIRKLIYFRVYNRWGQLLFESNDIRVGWDGTYQGTPQNTETYVYQVLVDTYRNENLSKSGTFKLLR